MSGADMDDLIARLEKATGPDRELDAEIFVAIDPHPKTELGFPITIWADGENIFWKGGTVTQGPYSKKAPHYTGSLDAAMRLLDGRPYVLAWSGQWADHMPRAGQPIYDAVIPDDTASYEDTLIGDMNELGPSSSAATQALALCIAALKARQRLSSGQSSVVPATKQWRG